MVKQRMGAVLLAAALMMNAGGLAEESCEMARHTAEDYRCEMLYDEPAAASLLTDSLLIGDSITDSLDAYGVLPEIEILAAVGQSPQGTRNNRTVRIEGMEGVYTMVDYAAYRQPERLLVMLGSNGLDTFGVSKVMTDYHLMLDEFLERLPDSEIYLLSVTPVRKRAAESYRHLNAQEINECNDQIRKLAQTHGVYYMDITTPLYMEDGSELIQEYSAGDGIHLKPEGAELVAQMILRQIRR